MLRLTARVAVPASDGKQVVMSLAVLLLKWFRLTNRQSILVFAAGHALWPIPSGQIIIRGFLEPQ